MSENRWAFTTGTLTGPHHTKRGEPNQDSFLAEERNGILVAAAADGAGSHDLSHLGSQLVVDLAVNEAHRQLAGRVSFQGALERAVDAAREGLLQEDESHRKGCTLAIAAVGPRGWGLAIVGDAFGLMKFGDELRLFQVDQEAEYANTTQLLTSSKITVGLWGDDQEEADAFATSTDGLVFATLQGSEPHRGFWDPIFQWAKAGTLDLTTVFESMEAQGRIDDDTTLVVGYRLED